jgi:hypothetical protein
VVLSVALAGVQTNSIAVYTVGREVSTRRARTRPEHRAVLTERYSSRALHP